MGSEISDKGREQDRVREERLLSLLAHAGRSKSSSHSSVSSTTMNSVKHIR